MSPPSSVFSHGRGAGCRHGGPWTEPRPGSRTGSTAPSPRTFSGGGAARRVPLPRPETSVNYPAGVVCDTGHGPGCDGPHPARRGGQGGDAPGVGDVTFIDGTGQFTFRGSSRGPCEVTFSLREPSPAGSSLGVIPHPHLLTAAVRGRHPLRPITCASSGPGSRGGGRRVCHGAPATAASVESGRSPSILVTVRRNRARRRSPAPEGTRSCRSRRGWWGWWPGPPAASRRVGSTTRRDARRELDDEPDGGALLGRANRPRSADELTITPPARARCSPRLVRRGGHRGRNLQAAPLAVVLRAESPRTPPDRALARQSCSTGRPRPWPGEALDRPISGADGPYSLVASRATIERYRARMVNTS